MTLTTERANELLSYDPDTGELRWKVHVSPTGRAGDIAGHLNVRGYYRVKIDGKDYQVHNVIWLMVMGEWPSPEIDHRDRDPSNNRLSNLREATKSQNGQNRSLRKDSLSGHRGVSFMSDRKKPFMAYVTIQGKRARKYCKTLEEAIAWRISRAKKLFGEFCP